MIGKTLHAVLFATALAVAGALQAAEVAGVRLADSVQAQGQTLQLNGAGLRSRLVFKVYVAALYLPARTARAADVVDGPGPCRVALHMLRDVDADTLLKALQDGIADNHPAAEVGALAAPLAQLARIMRGIGTARSGDTVVLDFSAGGVEVGLNGQPRGGVPDAALARALLRVWLGERPVDPALKKALLGG